MHRSGRDPTLLDNATSQLLPDDDPTPRRKKRMLELDDIDLGLDFGLEPGEQAVRSVSPSDDRSIEIGRRAQTPRRDEPTLLDNDDLGLDFGLDGDTTIGGGGPPIQDGDNDLLMLDADDAYPAPEDHLAAQNAAAFARAEETADRRRRETDSPLSELRASVERELDQTFGLPQDEEDSTMVQAQQRAKRRKVMQQDNETQLHNSQIKRQQEDRSAITKAPTMLPRDPLLLQLQEMQRNGSFVSNIMGMGRMEGWASELRGILSLEVIRKAGDKKRKRDSGIADVETDEDGRQETPQLEIPDAEDDVVAGAGADFGAGLMSDGMGPPLHEEPLPEDDDQGYIASPGGPAFDQTEMPLLHPSQAGPVSQGTKKAVHLLREHFAPGHPTNATEPPSPSKRTKSEALFTDLCPERSTGRKEATQMFFELLVLGTKDAVKVEQNSSKLGGPIRVRGKRGLWGQWAETGAGGEIAEQVDEEQEV
jgi:cohesin complex subunit SCC1